MNGKLFFAAVAMVIFWLTVLGGIGYAVVHFIRKFW